MNIKKQILANQKLNQEVLRKITAKLNQKKSKKNDSAFTMVSWGAPEVSKTESFKTYIGVVPCEIVAFNPTAQKIAELYDRPIGQEPVYYGTRKWGENEVEFADCVFYLKSVKELCGFERIFRLRISILNDFYTNKDHTKLRIVDAYNRTAWIENEVFKQRGIPMYKTGPAEIDPASYRPLYRNCEFLNNFLRAYRGVAPVKVYDPETNGQKTNPDLASAMGIVDSPEKFFKGDFKEIIDFLASTDALAAAAGTPQKVKVAIGVRNNDGKFYQDVYPEEFEKFRSKPSSKTGEYRNISYALKDATVNGRFSNTEFSAKEVCEYTAEPSDVVQTASIATPQVSSISGLNFAADSNESKFPWE